MFEAFGLTLEEFHSYIDECKAKGFTVDPGELDDFYSAYNEDGYKIYTSYHDNSRGFSMTVNGPEETTETESSDNGETTSLSALAQKIKGFDHPVQGTVWFTYNGERLSDLRDRLEKEDTK